MTQTRLWGFHVYKTKSLLIVSLLFALPAYSQMGPPQGGQQGQPQGGAPQGAAQSQVGAPQAAAPSGSSAGADARFGLIEVANKKVITFEEALARASEASYDLRIAQERIRQQEAQVRRAWSFLLPQVNASANYSYNCIGSFDNGLNCADQTIEFVSEEQLTQQQLLFGSIGELIGSVADAQPDLEEQERLRAQSRELFAVVDELEVQKNEIEPTVIAPANLVTGALSVVQPLFNGRSLPLLQNAYSAVDAMTLARNQGRSALLYGVARAYYGAYTAKRFVSIANQQLQSAERHLAAVKSRVELNSATPLALRRAELDVLRAKQSVRSAQAATDGAIATLGNLMDVEEAFDIEAPKALRFDLPTSSEKVIDLAYQNRIDLRLAKVAVEIADRGKTDAWMTFLPSVNLVGQASATSNASGFIAAPFNASLSLQASIPIYDGGARYAQLREAHSKIREELLKVRQLEKQIAGQIRGNMHELELKESALLLAEEALTLAKLTAEQASELRGLGAATDLDVSDAQLGVFASELEFVRAELDVEQARMDLSYIAGTFATQFSQSPAKLTSDERDSARELLNALGQSNKNESAK